MRTYQAFSSADVSHRTVSGSLAASWRICDGDVRVMFVDDTQGGTPAYRWPDEPMAMRPGHIAFEIPYPTVQRVRELLPSHRDLWDAVEAEYRRSLVSGPTARRHAEFFDLPY